MVYGNRVYLDQWARNVLQNMVFNNQKNGLLVLKNGVKGGLLWPKAGKAVPFD